MQNIILGFLIGFIGFGVQQSNCICRRASSEDKPQGANEVVEYDQGRVVRQMRGRVLNANGEAIADAVVEVYRYPINNKELSASLLTQGRNRQKACITDSKGRFCFKDMPPGQYALKIGTRKPEGMNEAYVKIRLSHKGSMSRGIDVVLTVGT